MLKNYISNLLRKLGVIHFIDDLRFYKQKIQNKKQNDLFKQKHTTVKLPPDYLIYEAFQLRYDSYYYGGKLTAEWILDYCSKYKTLENLKILDWGCGPARVIRHIPDLIDLSNEVYGTDYNALSIEWCQKNLANIEFSVNDINPPLQYKNEQFDIIYGISIFTHLSEELHYQWIDELYRVLNIGGILLLSMQGDNFRVKLTDHERESFDNGSLVVRGNVKDGHRVFSAFHPTAFMKKIFKNFTILEHVVRKPEGMSTIPQDLWIIQK
ncbi:Methyltransferase domain-containing protein [Chryseobacterium soldanellicola]|uniref:Methyltransferase domain-containing protein n=1 Tax=Chryseobacterium soldanellicola TaxID=311333 RepID=A0A1H1BDZ9_9FLAO|nr:class I SAM-dependent methyltransferase [Chryseobacterium soldanellicola]SDQ50189.1 Methyltransferase domain-containing protein [Chryseobacterium soldanellicola]